MSRPIYTATVVFEKLPKCYSFLQPVMTKEFNDEDDAENWINNILPYQQRRSDCKYSWCILFGVKLSSGDYEKTKRGTTSNTRSK